MTANAGSMLDNYLIAQALGWNWDFGTMVLLWGIEFGIFLLIVIGILTIMVLTD